MEILSVEVEEFCRRFPNANWTGGNCYWFAVLLQKRFPFFSIYYDWQQGHFVAGINGVYFDWTGRVFPEKEPYEIEALRRDDPLWYSRIMEANI